MGWFYPPAQPPSQPPLPEKVPQGAVAVDNVPPPPSVFAARQAAIRSAWAPEAWPAQASPITAGQLSTPVINRPFPQPFWNYTLQANVRSTWPTEQWPSQVLTGGGIGGTTATAIVIQTPPTPLAQLMTIRAAWPQEQWPAQTAPPVAGSSPISQPVIYVPSLPVSFFWSIRMQWLPDYWYAQSEAAVASGIALTQLPPPYNPSSIVPTISVLRSSWPQELWGAQTAVLGAGAQIPPVVPLPYPIQHVEFKLWPVEQWPAQAGTRGAPAFAVTLPPSPYISIGTQMGIRMAWPTEAWPAQRAAVIEPVLPQTINAVPWTRVPQFTSRLWPADTWPAQPGSRTKGAQTPPFIITPATPRGYDIQKIAALWPQEQWPTRLAGTSAGALAKPAGPPIPPPVFTLPVTSYGGRVALSPKKLSETAFQTMDFLSRLGVGETIVGAGVTCTLYSGTDPNPTAMISGVASVSGSIVVQAVTGGVIGSIYELLFKVQTSTGQILALSGYFPVEPDLP